MECRENMPQSNNYIMDKSISCQMCFIPVASVLPFSYVPPFAFPKSNILATKIFLYSLVEIVAIPALPPQRQQSRVPFTQPKALFVRTIKMMKKNKNRLVMLRKLLLLLPPHEDAR